MTFVLSSLGFLIPLISGVVSTSVVGLLKAASATLDTAPAWMKQAANVLVATIVVVLANQLGVTLADDPTVWGTAVPKEAIQALVAALIAHVIHSGKKVDQQKDAALPMAPDSPFRLP